MADQHQPKKKRSGGPKTAAGKAQSRMNAMKHGNRSVQCLILPDETMEEYTALRGGWLNEFQPESFAEKSLVDELIQAHWLFKRAQRRLLETEFAIAGPDNVHPVDWPEEDEHKIELMQRYKTSAERSFYRALHTVRQWGKDKVSNELKVQKMNAEIEALKKQQEPQEKQGLEGAERSRRRRGSGGAGSGATASAGEGKSRAEQLFRGQRAKKKMKKLVTLEQWVEIEATPEGGAVTTLYPSNAELIQNGQKLWPPPTLVVRRLNFVGAIPREYEWALESYAGDAEKLRTYGGCGLQRIEVDAWLKHIETEEAAGTGHLLPTENVPRPQERGGCECPVCMGNEGILDDEEEDGEEEAA
jgi:hypothetical protein